MNIRKWIASFFTVLVLAFSMRGNVQAANMIEAAKAAALPKGSLVTRAKGVRYKLASNGYAAKDKWYCVNGDIYYFDKEGYAKTGFFTYNKKHYYADENGRVQYSAWINKNGKLYYVKKNGVRCENVKKKIKGQQYTFNAKGVVTGNKPSVYPGSHYLFVGDSRTVGMATYVSHPDNVSFVGKVGEGYSYLSGSANSVVRSRLSMNPYLTVIFAMGVNDPGNAASYITYYKNIMAAYPKARFFFMAVNPVSGGSKYITNAMITDFNAKLKSAVPAASYIDTYSYLMSTGYSTWDGVHYTVDTYSKIYAYVMGKVKM